MDYKQRFNGGKLCKITGITKRALRLWRDMGLINYEKDKTNGYYRYNIFSFTSVWVVKCLQQAGMILSEISKKELMSIGDLKKLYKQKSQNLEEQIQVLLNAKKNVNRQIDHIESIEKSKNNKIRLEEPPFDCVAELDFTNDKFIQDNADGNNYMVTVVSKDKYTFKYGFSCGVSVTNNPIWAKNNKSKFIRVLVNQKDLSDSPVETQIARDTINPVHVKVDNYYLEEEIIINAPDKEAAKKLAQTDYRKAKPGTLKEIIDTLSDLGYGIKNILFVWLLNTNVEDNALKFFDAYLEF